MKQFYAFSFIAVFSLAVQPVPCLENQIPPSNANIRKRNIFFKEKYLGIKFGNGSTKYLRFNATERNGSLTTDRNYATVKTSRNFFPFDVKKRNPNFTAVHDEDKKNVTMQEDGIRSRTITTHERNRRSVTNYTLLYGLYADNTNATSFKQDERERENSPTQSAHAERNDTTFIRHERRERGRERGSSPSQSADERNDTTFIIHERRERERGRGSSPSQSTDERNNTTFIIHDRRERESFPKNGTHEENRRKEYISLSMHTTARSNFLEKRKNISHDGNAKSHTIRDRNKNKSRENTISSYQSLDLALKGINETQTLKPPTVNRKMTCCANVGNETVLPAVNLTLTTLTPPTPKLLIARPFNGTITPIHKSIALVLKPWREVKLIPKPIKCPKSKPIFDTRTKKCIQKTVFLSGVKMISLPKTLIKLPTTSNRSLVMPVLNTKNISIKCTVLQRYEKHEYIMMNDNNSAIFVKKTGEVLKSKDYFRNSTSANDSQAIFVCRQHQISNCSGVYILMKEGEFRVLMNKSIFVNASKQVYDWSEYTWINKSVLVCGNISTFYKLKVVPNDDPILTTITIVCMSLSIIGLVFVLVTYSLFSELRTPPGINLMNLSVSILLAQLLWLLGSGQTDTTVACTVIAVILHYLFLVSFMWTSIIAFDTWRAFSAKGRRPLAGSKAQRIKHFSRHMAVGWLSILMYVVICVAFDELNITNIGYGTAYGCFIDHYRAKLYFFGLPILLFIFFNLCFYSMTVKAIKETRSQTRVIDAQQLGAKRDFWIYVRIGALMGFTWIFGLAAPLRWQFLWYPFVILNSLQGVYIALAFGINKRARKLYVDLMRARGKKQVQEKGVSNQERNTKQSAVVLQGQLLATTDV